MELSGTFPDIWEETPWSEEEQPGEPQALDILFRELPLLADREVEEYMKKRPGTEPYSRKIEFNGDEISLVAVTGGNLVLVFFGIRSSDKKPVALRTLNGWRLGEHNLQERFLRERHFLERRNDDSVRYWPEFFGETRIKHATLQGLTFPEDVVLLEFLPGELLDKFLKKNPNLRTREFISAVAIQIAHALEFIHEDGYVLRDLKGENVMVVRPQPGKPFIRLFDGNALWVPHSTITPPGVIFGTVDVMSPELARGESSLDGRSDIYSLGCLMYYMMTGRALFSGEYAEHILTQHVEGSLPEFPNIYPPLEDMVRWFLSKNREERPKSALEARKHLVGYFRSAHPQSLLIPYIGSALEI